MKIKLLWPNHSTIHIPMGAVGEAMGYRITANSVLLKCVFYGYTGIHDVDIRDAVSLMEV